MVALQSADVKHNFEHVVLQISLTKEQSKPVLEQYDLPLVPESLLSNVPIHITSQCKVVALIRLHEKDDMIAVNLKLSMRNDLSIFKI